MHDLVSGGRRRPPKPRRGASPWRSTTVGGVLAVCAAGCASSIPPPLNPGTIELFGPKTPLRGQVEVIERRGEQALLRVRLSGPDGEQHEVNAVSKRIGNLSQSICEVPKALLRWREGTQTAFETRSVFANTHCTTNRLDNPALPTGRQVYGQLLAHRWLEVVGLPAMRTRFALLRYTNLGPREGDEPAPALLVEPAREAARRLGGRLLNEDADEFDLPIARYTELDPRATASLVLFQLLVGNGDWFVAGLASLRLHLRDRRGWQGAHNIFLVGFDDRAPRPLALDFDLSALAGVAPVSAAIANIRPDAMIERLAHPAWARARGVDLGLLEMGLYLWCRQFDRATRSAVIAEWLDYREGLYAELDDPFLLAEVTTRARAMLDRFYAVLTEPRGRSVTRGARTPLFAAADDRESTCLLPEGTPIARRRGPEREGRVAVRVIQRLVLDGQPPRPLCGAGVESLEGFVEPDRLLDEGDAPWRW